ncbi:MAG: 50S ribosomal protein L24 [Acidimicrobiaceae bacterium]|nr:50S ribosomal protein L24 [Acidimicrobiaceae bacterium]
MRLRKGDKVKVLSGKDVGKVGEIITVLPKDNKVIVEGVNSVRKHQRPTKAMQNGGILDKLMPIQVSNVALVCPKCGVTRVAYKIEESGVKNRVCPKCGGDL